MMSAHRAFLLAVACVFAVIAYLFWQDWRDARSASERPKRTASVSAATTPRSALPKVAAGAGDAPSDITVELNSPTSNIRRDLEVASELFVAWQSNFPRAGNPVGENAEITAALLGDNALRFAFLPRGHRALNGRGELCDRWGTPFRFHSISAQHMEIRSAGPDRKFATADDAQWPDESGSH